MKTLHILDISRNKLPKGKNPKSLRKEISLEKGSVCYICGKSFNFVNLVLEHKIPVELGEHLFERENVDLVCGKCHRDKTTQDLKIIKILKDLKVVFNFERKIIYSFYTSEELKQFYLYLTELYKGGVDNFENVFLKGEYNQDYNSLYQKDNRKENSTGNGGDYIL